MDADLRVVMCCIDTPQFTPDDLAEAVGIDQFVRADTPCVEVPKQSKLGQFLDCMWQHVDAEHLPRARILGPQCRLCAGTRRSSGRLCRRRRSMPSSSNSSISRFERTYRRFVLAQMTEGAGYLPALTDIGGRGGVDQTWLGCSGGRIQEFSSPTDPWQPLPPRTWSWASIAHISPRPERPCSDGISRSFWARIETPDCRDEIFAAVRDLDGLARERIRSALRRAGRGPATKLTVLSDGEDAMQTHGRGLVERAPWNIDWTGFTSIDGSTSGSPFQRNALE